jgi:hypothetical protein
MKTASLIVRTPCPQTIATRLRTVCAKGLPLLLLLALPAAAQAQFTYSNNNGAITITGYTGSAGVVTIPSTTNGLPVTSVGDWAFADACYILTSVTIPDSVTNIGINAFQGGGRLTNVSFGNHLTSIGDSAFISCYPLTNITLPISLTSIGNSAFAMCDNLRGVYFEGNAPSVGTNVFAGDLSLTVYYVPGTTGWGATLDGSPTAPWWPYARTINNATITLTAYTGLGGAVAIPGAIYGLPVTGIGDAAFASCALTSVTIPASVTSLGVSAFASCALTNVTIPSSVTSLGDNAFSFCASLTSAIIGSGVTNLGACAFLSCPSLTAVFFQGNAPGADASAFDDDSHATVYYLPGTTGWASTFAGRPTMLWNPQAQTSDGSFGVRTNRFGFNITGSSNLVIVVEACTNLANPAWSPVHTNTLTGGSSYFSDPQWTNHPARFYRLRSP